MSAPTIGTTVYAVKDASGRLVAEHVRKDLEDGSKQCMWRQPSGKWGLNGTRLEELPLYGVERLPDWPEDRPVILVEGEKAADAINSSGDLFAVGTVTGAAATPGDEAFAPLKGREVVIWPDADDAGRRHMERNAEKLAKVADYLRLYDWLEAPKKGADAADHPAILAGDEKALGMLLNDLLGAPQWTSAQSSHERGGAPTAPASPADKPPTPTHDELRDRFLDEHPGYSYGLGDWRCYADGVWPASPELTVKRLLSTVIEEAKPEGIRPTSSLLNSVTELTRVKIAMPDEAWDADPDLLVCRNGALRISTRVQTEHDPEHQATSAVPYDYAADSVAPVWRAFLKWTLGEETASFLQEFAGYALTTDTALEAAVWLYGPPGSGKSTFLSGLQAMLGPRSGLLGLAEIERNRFALADLPGKTLVVASEQPSAFLASTNLLNAIISGESLQVERKYRDPVTVVPRCKIAWAMNELPRVADANSGLFRRVKVIRFPDLPAEQRDPDMKRSIEGEGAGILNWALDGLARLKKRGGFEVPDNVTEATEHFRENNDVPALFVADRCMKDAETREQASSLYGEYKQWCEENGHRPQSSTRLADDWQRLGFERYRSKGVTYYRGVRVRLSGD